MPHRHPPKRPAIQNTIGLCNRPNTSFRTAQTQSISESESNHSTNEQPAKRARAQSRALSPEIAGAQDLLLSPETDGSWHLYPAFDSMKFVASRDQSDEESDAEIIIDNEPFTPADDNKACTQLIDFAISIGDDPSDEAWLPPREA
ncbi:hypothetical protein SERLA73DRAFT_154776 [Serpula lacrymans var. lacrymans S7.3]|uniref:Uncharacterized protein n=2 Tax=Serpula lacrymans var. lacrymans TaxID=341189 RepID=F8Q5J9_SERL3|nr:uncharacterized protein SERLADRAFT_441244 [Serpula lacrymans var. lacrymans S7.9]EGN96470.1 hypothetical protein SERLA73DRAFT_154776 [Serpula lacrymans var. lacrymans S7.3]EGO22019.1 hypothetical protein SERLADRAFT_441244 [Serpula lacrymans var. lacrymans S7.9]